MSDAGTAGDGNGHVQVYDLSGKRIFSGNMANPVTARDVKRRLQEHTRISRFQQRLLRDGAVMEDADCAALPVDMQLVKIGFLPQSAQVAGDMAHAARHENTRHLEQLLLMPHDPNCSSATSSPLLWAAEFGRFENVKMLLEARADLSLQPNIEAFVDKARHGDLEMVRIFLRAGCPLEARNRNGMTAFSAAASSGQAEVVEELLEARADTMTRNNRGRQPLALAAWKGNEPMVQLLLASRCDPTAAEPGPLTRMPASRAKDLFAAALASKLKSAG